jgi:hypothetical protein
MLDTLNNLWDSNSPKNTILRKLPFSRDIHGMYDHSTGRYACVSTWSATMNALHRCNLNYTPSFILRGCHTIQELESITTINYWLWAVDVNRNMIMKPEMLNPLKIKEYRMMAEKAASLDYMYSVLFAYRRSIQKELPFQDLAYFYKEREAQLILAGNQTIDECPFVQPYADIRGISLMEAANEIVLHAKMMRIKLADSERIRTKYQHMIVEEREINLIPDIVYEFKKEVTIDSAV